VGHKTTTTWKINCDAVITVNMQEFIYQNGGEKLTPEVRRLVLLVVNVCNHMTYDSTSDV